MKAAKSEKNERQEQAVQGSVGVTYSRLWKKYSWTSYIHDTNITLKVSKKTNRLQTATK